MASLAGARKPARVLAGADGGQVAVLAHGGRVLGLFAPGSRANFLWTSPALRSAASARALFASDGWCNPGGDRAWLAPESELFFPEFPDRSVYRPPRELDPGAYRCTADDGAIGLVSDCAVVSFRWKEKIRMRITRRVAPAENPLRSEPALAEGLAFAGYALESALELRSGPGRTAVGLWHLLQLPPGGEMLIPTYSRAKPRVYFGRVPAEDLAIEDGLVRYRMRSAGTHKIGVRAAAATGRVGYVHRSGRQWRLVVRSFAVDPGGLYADYPPGEPGEVGYAVQACSVCEPELGRFSELEYHVPAIGGSTGRTGCRDVSQVWAFGGSAGQIRAAAEVLLGAALRKGKAT
jgi:hypothetical protein